MNKHGNDGFKCHGHSTFFVLFQKNSVFYVLRALYVSANLRNEDSQESRYSTPFKEKVENSIPITMTRDDRPTIAVSFLI